MVVSIYIIKKKKKRGTKLSRLSYFICIFLPATYLTKVRKNSANLNPGISRQEANPHISDGECQWFDTGPQGYS